MLVKTLSSASSLLFKKTFLFGWVSASTRSTAPHSHSWMARYVCRKSHLVSSSGQCETFGRSCICFFCTYYPSQREHTEGVLLKILLILSFFTDVQPLSGWFFLFSHFFSSNLGLFSSSFEHFALLISTTALTSTVRTQYWQHEKRLAQRRSHICTSG